MDDHNYDLFVSYAQENQPWVEGYLLDTLEAAEVRVHTEEAFTPGTPRLLEFEKAVKNSARTLLVITPAYLAENFVQFVDLLAQSYGLETATWPVIPLLLEPAELPTRLAMLNLLDATDPDEWEVAIARLLRAFEQPLPAAPSMPDCPYPGMVPFSEADSARFFGREAEIQEMLERLRLYRFLTVIGPSGSGKSSLVYAGLLPALRKSRLFGKSDWQFHSMRPGEKPYLTLKAILNRLQRGMGGLKDNTLLFVDQFEETFTSSGSEAQKFQETVLKLTHVPNLYIVLTVRADFYTDLMASPLWGQIQEHRLEVTPLDARGLRAAIVQPAEQNGVFIESALVERLLADAAGEPGVLPLVQETLVLLWEKIERRFLPMRAYASLVLPRQKYGEAPMTGLQVAIARRADQTLQQLSPEGQGIARRIFLRLIQFGEGRADTRRQQGVGQLRSENDNPQKFEETLRALANSRLITLSGEESQTDGDSQRKVDISHEALITGWPTLQQWIAERREAELARRQLENKAAEWVRLGQGAGGLLDEIEYREAERWLDNPDVAELGYSPDLMEFIRTSRGAIDANNRQKEATQRRELKQAQALAAEQEQRANEQAQASKRFQRIAIGMVAVVLVAIALAGVSFTTWRNLVETQGNAATAVARGNAAGTEAAAQQIAADAAGTKAAVQEREANTAATEAVKQQRIANSASTEAALAKENESLALQDARNQKATAEAERDAAEAARAEAVANANLAATNEANAIKSQQLAERNADTILDMAPRSMKGFLFDYYTNSLQRLVFDLVVEDYIGELEYDSESWTTLGRTQGTRDNPAQTYAISRESGSGKVLAVGHEAIIGDVEYAKDFLEIALNYLNGNSNIRSVLISSGHCERGPDKRLDDQLKQWGYQVTYINSRIDDAELDRGSILVVANAWGAFEQSEIDSVRRFVEEGGGLFVGGYGYGWQATGRFESNNECLNVDIDEDLSRYPMNLLLAPFEMEWTPYFIRIPKG